MYRSRQTLADEYLIAVIGVDTTEKFFLSRRLGARDDALLVALSTALTDAIQFSVPEFVGRQFSWILTRLL